MILVCLHFITITDLVAVSCC